MQRAALEYLIEHPLENVTATIIIKDSLMKHIPMKVTADGLDYTDALRCPVCGTYVGSQEDGLLCNYCGECGQRIVR